MLCQRTFSTYTGTALHYVKRIDLWDRYLRAMAASLSVRSTAAYLGIHRDTAFRWRHRILTAGRASPSFRLSGDIQVDTTWFPYLDKAPGGSNARHPRSRPPGPPAYRIRPDGDVRVWVVLAADGHRHRLAEVAGARPNADIYSSTFGGRIGPGSRLFGGTGRYSPLAVAATRMSLPYEPRPRFVYGAPGEPRGPGQFRAPEPRPARIRRWLRPFRGVSSRYLDRYLLWFDVLEIGWRNAVRHPWVLGIS